MADRERKIVAPEGRRTGRNPRPGAASKGGAKDGGKDDAENAEASPPADENDETQPDEGDDSGRQKSSGLLEKAKGLSLKNKKKKEKKAEEQVLELEPITEFPRSFSIGVKFAGLSAVVVAFFMALLGALTYSITLSEVDGQITQRGVSAVMALEKGLDVSFWICPEEHYKKFLTDNNIVDKDAKNFKDYVNAMWSSQKNELQKQWGQRLNDLVNGSDGQILAVAVIENRQSPQGVALSAKQVQLSELSELRTVGKPGSPDRVEWQDAKLEGRRVRRFDKQVVAPDGTPVKGSYGEAWVSLFVNAQKIDDVRDQVWQRIALVTSAGALAGIILTVLIAAVLTRPIRTLESDIAVVAEGDLEHETAPSSRDEIGALAHTFNIMTRNLKAAQQNAANQKAIERELAIATEIQTKLLPERLPQIPGLDIQSFYLSAKEVGGDYYDFIVIDQTHLGIIVADVSGKGIPGSMVMTMARSLVRLASVRNISPADTFKKVNRILAKDIRRGMFVTSIYMVLNVKTHELKVASAGHNPLLVFRASTGEVEPVKPQGIALGFDKGTIFDTNIQEAEIKLEPGDRIVAHTDGVNEAMNAESEEFGDDKLIALVKQHAKLNSKDFVSKIVASLEEHRGQAEQSDDITITTLAVAK